LHSNQVKRQRFKKLFHLELQTHTQSKSTKKNLLHLQTGKATTKQSGKGLKVVSLGTANPNTKQIHKEKSIALANRAKRQR